MAYSLLEYEWPTQEQLAMTREVQETLSTNAKFPFSNVGYSQHTLH